MDGLAAAAAAARDAEEVPETLIEPDDLTRGELESDIEDGPDEADAELDATPPGGHEEQDEDQATGHEPDQAGGAPDAVAEAASPPPTNPEVGLKADGMAWTVCCAQGR